MKSLGIFVAFSIHTSSCFHGNSGISRRIMTHPRHHPAQLKASNEESIRTQLREKNEDLSDLSAKELKSFGVVPDSLREKLTQEVSFIGQLANKVIETIDDAYFGSLEEPTYEGKKEKVVVLGSGWGSHAFVSSLDARKYDTIIVSPRNFFLFTPMLAGAAVGTVEYRSITQPIRSANPDVDYLEATCTDIDTEKKTLECELVVCEGTSCEISDFTLHYDHLVIGVGATTNTFGIPGVKENCNYLKSVEDAAKLRRGIGNCFERANVPGLTAEQKEAALTFAVIGAGPTGVEFCAELCDFIEQDVPKYYPKLVPYVRVKVIEASDKVLMAFDSALQAKAIETLQARTAVEGGLPLVEVLLKAGVQEVTPNKIKLSNNQSLPYGLAVWAAGIGPLPLILDMTKRIEEQAALQNVARGKLVVDPWLRVKGCPGVYAIGDCAMVEGSVYPATAQVAAQQGSFLARLFSRNYNLSSEGSVPTCIGRVGLGQNVPSATAGYAKGFQFLNLGILAYLGDSQALAQIQVDEATIKGSGISGFALWRSVYLTKQVSMRNRVLVALDWLKTRSFGRDLTRL